jgi:small-conductance mechanosensitive channel
VAAGLAGIDLTTFGFLAGALGVGIGFGLQNIVSNFISGLILLFERPIQVGDTVDVSGAAGSVTEIGIRASTVRTFDGAEVIVPNADLISKPVTNWTRSNSDRRFDVAVGVAYGSPLEATAQALLAAARRTAGILSTPPPEAFFQSFGDSSLGWIVRIWTRMDESPRVLSDLKRAMSEELGKAKIEVPFPQRDLHIRSVVPGGDGNPLPGK